MMASATSAWTTSTPVWAWLSNPQYVSSSLRRSAGATGHPGRHDDGRSAAVTRRAVPAKAGAGVDVATADDTVVLGAGAAVVVVGRGADVVVLAMLVVGAASGVAGDPPQAASTR